MYHEINRYAVEVKHKRDQQKLKLKRMEAKLVLEQELEAKLDKELEQILGRAVSMADLEALYEQDLKLLNSIEAGLNNKIGEFRTLIGALWVQKAWRGFVAR